MRLAERQPVRYQRFAAFFSAGNGVRRVEQLAAGMRCVSGKRVTWNRSQSVTGSFHLFLPLSFTQPHMDSVAANLGNERLILFPQELRDLFARSEKQFRRFAGRQLADQHKQSGTRFHQGAQGEG